MHFLGWGRETILERILPLLAHSQVFVLVQSVLTDTPTHTEPGPQCPPTLAVSACSLVPAKGAAHVEPSTRICFSREQLLLIC